MKPNKLKIGINGFGRIGRAIFRVLNSLGTHQVVHINDQYASNPQQVQYLLSFDSIYGKYPGIINAGDKHITVTNQNDLQQRKIHLSDNKSSLQTSWELSEVNVIIEATGNQSCVADSRKLIINGPYSYVLITSHTLHSDINVKCVTELSYDIPKPKTIISASTCDMIAAYPIISTLMTLSPIESMHVVTIHPWLSYQTLLDGPVLNIPGAGVEIYENFAIGRSAANNVIPKSTSIETCIEDAFPILRNRVSAHSFRVPTSSVCYGEMCVRLNNTNISRNDVIDAFKSMAPVVDMSESPNVSSDFIGSSHASIIDCRWLRIVQDRIILVYAYDNEWGYACHIAGILDKISEKHI